MHRCGTKETYYISIARNLWAWREILGIDKCRSCKPLRVLWVFRQEEILKSRGSEMPFPAISGRLHSGAFLMMRWGTTSPAKPRLDPLVTALCYLCYLLSKPIRMSCYPILIWKHTDYTSQNTWFHFIHVECINIEKQQK